ncbi:MAG TPA: SDR family oxidoreductase [Ktedonobacterales bacterium]|nr:SDR family oxidoreductase [Ktedonobacterales bacterium]
MTTLWVTGANGVLGSAVVRQAEAAGTYDRITALGHSAVAHSATDSATEWLPLDLRDHSAIAELGRSRRPGVIINCGAMTNVDGCEDTPDLAWQINAEGPRALARVARDAGAALLHVSTDYVFPGDEANPGPYREDDPTRPISVYGSSKLGGEQAIMEELGSDAPWLIARTAIVIGTGPNQRPNFVTWLARELHAGHRVRIVTDQFNTPTLAEDLARSLLWSASAGTTGIYHTAGPTLLGRHEWALAIADHFRLSRDLIDWVTSDELKAKARRPLRSGLRCERLTADQARGAPQFLGAVECLGALDWGLDF